MLFYIINILARKLNIKNIKCKNLTVLILGFIIYCILYYLLKKLCKKKTISSRTLKIILLCLLIVDIVPVAIFLYNNEIKKPKKPKRLPKKSHDEPSPLEITNHATTTGTKNINDALGGAFNTKGESNAEKPPAKLPNKSHEEIAEPIIEKPPVEKSHDKVTEPIINEPPPVKPSTLSESIDNNSLSSNINSDNIMSIDEVLKLDNTFEQTNYTMAKSRTRTGVKNKIKPDLTGLSNKITITHINTYNNKKPKPKLTNPDLVNKLRNIHEIPENSAFTTTSGATD